MSGDVIFFHICLFQMPCDSSDMSLGDIVTIVSCNQSREMFCELSLGKFDFELK